MRLAELVACVLLVGACSAVPDTGIRIGDTTLDQFAAGSTRESWLLAVLGEPTSRAAVSDEPEVIILRYATVDREDPGLLGTLFGSPPARNVATIYFVVRGGVVERFWADRSDGGGLLGSDAKSGEKSD